MTEKIISTERPCSKCGGEIILTIAGWKCVDCDIKPLMESYNICDCGLEMVDESCHACFGEGGFHDCGEDTCACLDKSPNVICEDCNGEGSYLVCPNAEQHWKDSKEDS